MGARLARAIGAGSAWSAGPAERLRGLAKRLALPESVAEACRDESGRARVTPLETLSQRLSDEPDHSGRAMSVALDALQALEGDP